MKSWEQMKEEQLDVLKEIGNIGSGNAATALANLTEKTIDMKVPYVRILSFDEITEYVGGAEQIVTCIFLRIEGDITGSMYFFFDTEAAKTIVDNVLRRNNENSDEDLILTELEASVLQEVGNILSGSYLSALADFTKLNLQPTVPALAMDMVGSLLSYGFIESGKVGDVALVIDTRFLELQDEKVIPIKGQFVLLPDPECFQKLFESLGLSL
ncbi:chemotaxis protein CheC [Bacillus horti]|uniref:Chemotaxis protein CheC n=1 Tax=Caldalkalibacillus horti TaxID=77523 RepID=A0ABT9VUL9_9BACI|nr:chemotaxis protein CheC [Bacillus horti]MDQ0164686.1 chemotaxis protein CheC [Bacillus horti]